jgi:hypothetical protein
MSARAPALSLHPLRDFDDDPFSFALYFLHMFRRALIWPFEAENGYESPNVGNRVDP